MKQIGILVLIVACLFCSVRLQGKYSDDFMIGAYGELRSHYNTLHPSYNSALAHLAKEAGFNAIRGTAVYETDDDKVQNMLGSLSADSLDGIVEDLIFYPGPLDEKYGYSALATGNYMKFEAEYSSNHSVAFIDRLSDVFYYKSSDRVGNTGFDSRYSNWYYWTVPDTVGFAYKDLTYRWPKSDNSFDRVGPEFRFLGNYTNDYPVVNNNSLKIRFVFKAILPASLPDNEIIARFEFTSYKGSPSATVIDDFNLSKAEYQALTVVDPVLGLKEMTFTFPIAFLLTEEVCKTEGWYVTLKDLNPNMIWYGQGTLLLDYIEYYDTIYDQYTKSYDKRQHLRNFSSCDNLRYFYASDEPKSPHFESFRLLNLHLTGSGKDIVTAVNYDKMGLMKAPNTPYRMTDAFMEKAEPRILMIDRYPFTTYSVNWVKEANSSNFVQDLIDRVTNEYDYYRTKLGMGSDIKLYYIPQLFGEYKNSHWTYLWPPDKMAKCLQLLPLCYQADAIMSFKFDSIDNEHFALVNHPLPADLDNMVKSPQYDAVREANLKIGCYGPLLKRGNMTWLGAQKIEETSSSFPAESCMDNVTISAPVASDQYKGYVQLGFYTDQNNIPCLMSVNRRTTLVDHNSSLYAPGILDYVPPAEYNDHYTDAPPQHVRLTPSASAPSLFGTQDVAFIDPYDFQIYKRDGTTFIDVEIGPGDGKLLQMAGNPALVENQDVTASSLLAIKGALSVNSGSTFTITPGTKSYVDENTVIRVMNNATMIIEGDVRVGRNAQFKVDTGGTLIFNNANVTYLPGAKIISNHATVTVVNSVFTPAVQDSVWAGISTTNMSTLNIQNSKIVNAWTIDVTNTNLHMEGAKIEIPANGLGLNISDRVGGLSTVITSSDSTACFSGPSNNNIGFHGITIWATQSPIVITNQKFDYLESGIYCPMELLNNVTIGGCTFTSCHYGIRLMSKDISLQVSNSVFEHNVEGISATMGAVPLVTRCTFNSCETGIFSEYSLYSGIDPRQASNCLFFECVNGVVSRSSNARLIDNQFVRNEVGILSHVDSNLNLSVNANNRFNNTLSNLAFRDNDVYKAYIQLVFGHNDFYHTLENSQTANDFEFDDNYFELEGSSTISADFNWFQDQTVKVNGNDYSDYVIANNFDLLPNSAPPLEPTCRFYQALDYESQGLYSQARALYQLIIDEKLEGEDMYINSAIDGLFRLAQTPDHMYELIDLYSAEALETLVSNPSLSALLTDYLIKGYVSNKDYQEAIDLIQIRIGNAISEVDSLCAVLDLEIVLYLASIDEAKKPLTTQYQNLIYPTPQIFDVKHREHLAKLDELTGSTQQYTPPVIERALITSNYPNPFNPSTTIEYYVPAKGKAILQVFNLRGQLVDTLIDGSIDKGAHKIIWNGCDSTGRKASSGIYFLRLSTSSSVDTRKMLMIK